MTRLGMLLFATICFPTGIRTQSVSRVAPDWELLRTLYRLSYIATARLDLDF